MRFNSVLAGIALAATTVLAPMAAHAELVTNGGFETGDFTGWNVGANTGHTGIDTFAASGQYAGYFGAVGSPTALQQWINTSAGTLYTVSFDLANEGGSPASFVAVFAYQDLISLINAPASGYAHYSFDVLASQNLSNLSIYMQHDPAYWHLDNVSVVEAAGVGGAVPEPGTWAMLIAGFGMLGMAMRRRRVMAAA